MVMVRYKFSNRQNELNECGVDVKNGFNLYPINKQDEYMFIDKTVKSNKLYGSLLPNTPSYFFYFSMYFSMIMNV